MIKVITYIIFWFIPVRAIIVPFFKGFFSDIKTKKGFGLRVATGFKKIGAEFKEGAQDIKEGVNTTVEIVMPDDPKAKFIIGLIEYAIALLAGVLGTRNIFF